MAPLPPPFDAFLVQLAALDQAYQSLNGHFNDLGYALMKGGAAKLHVDRYNGAAVAMYKIQEEVLDLLRALGIPGIAPRPPFPPLFTTQAGSTNLSKLPDVVTRENLLVYFQHPRAPELDAGRELGIVPLIIWFGVGLTIGVVGGYIATGTLKNAISEVEKQRTARLVATLQSQNYKLQIDQIRWRALQLTASIEKCAGGNPARWPTCATALLPTVEATSVPPNLAKAIKDLLEAQRERGWLWWIGGIVVVAGLTVGGVYAYQHRRRLRGAA